MKVDSGTLAILFLVCVSLFAGVLLHAAMTSPHGADCFHAGEAYSEGARVDFSTGVQTCKAGKWE